MSLKEHDYNQYTKEKDEVEKYLLRIIQRYFDIENNYTKESIEAIIVESLTRIKQIMMQEKGFIFSLNQRTGHIVLTIKDFGGEYAFDKNSAFNKDFGTEANTICEGNDIRLEDAREPLYHVHEIAEVNGLKEQLEAIEIPEGIHVHGNKKVLDMLTYTGKQTQIDLIVLDYLGAALNEYVDILNYHKEEIKALHEKVIIDFSEYKDILQHELANIIDVVHNRITWIQEAYDYAKKEIDQYETDTMQVLVKYVSKERLQTLTDFFKKPFRTITTGEFPLQEGTTSYSPVVVETIISADSQEGDTLKSIYDEGLRIGQNDWEWDDTKNSFVFQSNVDYAMFASLTKFDTYTHRVTLKSNHFDDDTISVILAYDEATGYFLAVHCMLSTEYPRAFLCIGQNETKILQTITSEVISDISYQNSGWAENPDLGWWALEYGITVLVKREKNNFQVWVNCNTPNRWIPTTVNEITNIYPDEEPLFEFNVADMITSYPTCAVFKDTKNNYGYGCESQTYSTYEDIYFTGILSMGEEKTGYTNVSETSETKYTIPSDVMANVHNGRIKLFFKYDKDGKTIVTPLPFSFLHECNGIVIIQGSYTENGQIVIKSNFLNKAPFYIEDKNFYNQDTVIAACSEKVLYDNIIQELENQEASLCIVDGANKLNFIKTLMQPEKEYYIQGHNDDPTSTDRPYYDSDGNEVPYLDWDTDQPTPTFANYLIINTNGKMATSNVSKKYGYVAEYKIKKISQYFDNPRIYYQVLGNEEV